MARTLLIDAVGSRIAIDLAALDAGDEAAVREAWSDATIAEEAVRGLEPAATVAASGNDRERMLSSLSQTVTLTAIRAARGRAWMLHAAGIATPDGQVVVLVGPSGRGKTTAARALGAAYGYVSDETVAIDQDGRVWPYRKPLSLVGERAGTKIQLAASALGLLPLPDAELRIAAIVLLDRDPQHPDTPVVEITDVGDALGTLVSETSFLHHQPAPLRFIAALATATGGIRTVRYREAATLASVIPELARPASAIVVPEVPEHAVTDAVRAHGRPRFSRAPVADEVGLDDPDRIALLTISAKGRGEVIVLAGIAPAVWRAAEMATMEHLTDAATAAYGDPRGFDAAAAVRAAAGRLLDAGVLLSDTPALT